MVAAIVTADGLEAIGADGVREHDTTAAVTVHDKFHLGSCTKSMTATMLAMLVEDGTLTWKTTVGEVFANLGEKIDPQWKAVTIEQLVTHRSGAPANLDADGLWGRLWGSHGTPTEQRMMLVEGVITKPPAATPGTKYIYSNAGFAIAGAMAEKVTGTAWEDLMRKRLFEPLGMKSAGFGAPGSAEVIDQPRGHRQDGKAVLPGIGADNPAAIGPAGTVHCTIEDWGKYIQFHLNGEKGKNGAEINKLLKAESFVRLHTPFASEDQDKYAMGWIVAARPWAKGVGEKTAGKVLTHGGSNTMWFCVTWLAPERDFAVLIACNQGGEKAAKACDEAAWAMIQEHLRKRD